LEAIQYHILENLIA